MRRFLFLLFLAAAGWWFFADHSLRHPPGITAPFTPAQELIPHKSLGEIHGYHLEAQATYALHARVLHTKRYWTLGDDLVPYDIALGWGSMSDQAVLDRLSISQSNRFFFYEWRDAPPIPAGEIVRSAANTHIIPANKTVAKAVSHLRAGELVAMRGYLVNASKPDGFHWNSSLSREDSGNGACELFYVEELLLTDQPWPTSKTAQATGK